ncbi:MAG: deoxyribonuclease IV [Gemmatimonadota bacterium]|nr:deoxyribonuclease IV [Gemmatimonadota bacterium]
MEFLGAHVSTAGGVDRAPARGTEIGATAIQVFTKVPNQWREPEIVDEVAERFDHAMRLSEIGAVVSHDSYLINLASPDKELRNRSIECFKGELARCAKLGIPYVVSHPGNFMDDRKDGISRNADAYSQCLDQVEGPIVLMETTAGTGTALGATFHELAELRTQIPQELRDRVGFCADTCHLYSAGYDLENDYDAVWNEWDSTLGLENLHCLHLNDSKTPFASRKDRHELIGEGTIGPEPFRRIMNDPRLARVIKILETPKGDDAVKTDRKMLARLRQYRENDKT